MPVTSPRPTAPKLQTDAYFTLAPTLGTKYEWRIGAALLGTQTDVRIIQAYATATWTVQPTPLEIHATIDGILKTCAFTNPVSNTPYGIQKYNGNPIADANWILTTGASQSHPFIFEGRQVKMEAEITGGTVSALLMRIIWAKW